MVQGNFFLFSFFLWLLTGGPEVVEMGWRFIKVCYDRDA
jgi:hypothetical protein